MSSALVKLICLITRKVKSAEKMKISKGAKIRNRYNHVCLFVCVALRPKSTAMVIAGRSVHLTTLFPGQA